MLKPSNSVWVNSMTHPGYEFCWIWDDAEASSGSFWFRLKGDDVAHQSTETVWARPMTTAEHDEVSFLLAEKYQHRSFT